MEIRLKKMDECRWLIPKTGEMRVPGLVFSSEKLIKETQKDQSLLQVANVATLPGRLSLLLGGIGLKKLRLRVPYAPSYWLGQAPLHLVRRIGDVPHRIRCRCQG